MHDFRKRTSFEQDELRILAKSGALNPLIGHRRDALWSVESEFHQGELFSDAPVEDGFASGSDATDRTACGRFLHDAPHDRPHPMGYIRKSLPDDIWRSADLPFGRERCTHPHCRSWRFVVNDQAQRKGLSLSAWKTKQGYLTPLLVRRFLKRTDS